MVAVVVAGVYTVAVVVAGVYTVAVVVAVAVAVAIVVVVVVAVVVAVAVAIVVVVVGTSVVAVMVAVAIAVAVVVEIVDNIKRIDGMNAALKRAELDKLLFRSSLEDMSISRSMFSIGQRSISQSQWSFLYCLKLI